MCAVTHRAKPYQLALLIKKSLYEVIATQQSACEATPGPERSGNTVFIQYRISDFQQCLPSANTVEDPVGKQCTFSNI